MASDNHTVYCIYDHDNRLAKFGVSNRPELRFDRVRQQTKSNELQFVGSVGVETRSTALELEKVFFESFANARCKHPINVTQGEWFAISPKDAKFALKIARNLVDTLSKNPHSMYSILSHQRGVAKQVAQRLERG